MKKEIASTDSFSDVFKTLSAINVNGHTEKKKTGSSELTYLSWAWAWGELMKVYPDATYEVTKYGEDQQPYFYDPSLGYMCHTTMTINGIKREMWLPVMDGANNAMKSQPYTIQGRYGNKTVAAATMFDINKTIMRCLVKNIGMFGLGLYIYAGEDLPESEQSAANDGNDAILEEALKGVKAAKTMARLTETWQYYAERYPEIVASGSQFYNAWIAKRQEFKDQKA